ncbi:MAG: carboxypeptidase-like regulatory domain-containing protein, partial [Saprospiraceae bacterium]|nr:carboxypeptidase-like regulatory domain-containing protein [Saprospiraceae bacterium]
MNDSGFPPSIKQLYMSVVLLLTVFSTQWLSAQTPGGGRPGGGNFNPAQMNIGRFYGKIVDNETGKGIAYASIQLVGMQWDTVTKRMEKKVVGGQLTEENGEFSLENLPVMGDFTLKVNYLGYATIEQTVTFGIKPGQGRPGGGGGGGQRPNMGAGAVEKDLGNIRLSVNSTVLKEVEISAEATRATLALDKKVYRVDKDNVAAGGTAEDALKNIPSLNVDIDGNLTLRNAAPQLFIDGRPTPLSLDQIPADAIENVEVITNPSARFDAGGGQSGIVNIVLKKERKIGYNGSVRTGVDMRGRFNLGGDINAREGKMNVFLGGNYNQRRNLSTGQTDRYNLINGVTDNRVLQNNESENNGFFGSGRAGIDWFINNRNTLTIGGNIHGGTWNNEDDI